MMNDAEMLTAMERYEAQTQSQAETLQMFSELVSTGRHRDGSYARMAQALVRGGYLTETGEITAEGYASIARTDGPVTQ